MAARGGVSFRSWLFGSTVIVLLLAIVGETRVDARATLKLQMMRYENPSSKDYGGSCCDLFCWSKCDHIFRFALDVGNSGNNPKGSHYWAHTTNHFQDQNTNTFGGNMNGVNNPIMTFFRPRWPRVGVKLKVWVTDDDGIWSGDDDVDGLVQLLRLTPARSSSTASWTIITVRGRRASYKTSLTLKYMLYCNPNYYSSDCSVYCVASNSDIGGHYTCDPATGNIICRPGWEDVTTRCRRRSDDCIGHRCLNGATCVDGVRSYTCRCRPGYTGRYCQVNTDECASSPCLNGGTCTDLVASYHCTCPSAYIGRTCATPYCLANNPCRNGGVCYGAGLCRCPPGFIGSDCSGDLCQLVTCHNGGSCINGSCVCPAGIAGSTCDVDMCDLKVCLNGGVCRRGACACPAGFTGEVCETNIDECASNPCLNGGTCYDLVNGYSCSCTSQYTGHTCSVSYCNTNNPCRNGATCYGTGRCLCRPGFIGADCSIARCDVLECQNGGSCVNGSCVCPAGIIGANCDLVLCSIMICMNGGTCSDGTCTCPPGFTGRLCEIDIDDCLSDPCEHDGTCDDHENGFTCRCLPGFTGKLCSEIIPPADVINNSSYVLYEPVEDQPSGQMDALDIWFYASFVVIFVLLVIILILSICLCNKRRKAKINIDSDRPAERPAPEAVETAAAAAAAARVVENEYYSIKKQSKVTVEDKLDKGDEESDDDPLYESIRGGTSAGPSSVVTPEPQRNESYKNLCDPELGESTSL